MCRMVAYLGPSRPLDSVWTRPGHGLLVQSYAPREMNQGTLNADGWGIGWFAPEVVDRPAQLRGTLPAWSDENLRSVAQAVAARCFVAIVRSASPSIPTSLGNTPPFVLDSRLLAHNGRIWPWPSTLARTIRAALDPEVDRTILGTTDTELLGALWQTQIRKHDQDIPVATRHMLGMTRDWTAALGGGLTANLLLLEPERIWATRFATPGDPPTLYFLRSGRRWKGAVLVASEPLDDDPAWSAVPPSTLLEIDGAMIRSHALDL